MISCGSKGHRCVGVCVWAVLVANITNVIASSPFTNVLLQTHFNQRRSTGNIHVLPSRVLELSCCLFASCRCSNCWPQISLMQWKLLALMLLLKNEWFVVGEASEVDQRNRIVSSEWKIPECSINARRMTTEIWKELNDYTPYIVRYIGGLPFCSGAQK